MPHLDEGMIHAWLDSALTDEERTSAEAHVAECESCSAAVAEARGLIAASSRILSALDDVPAGVIPIATRAPEMTTSRVGTRESPARRWITHPMMRAAAALLLVATGTFFVASREEAKRELILASDKAESRDSAVRLDTTFPEVAVLMEMEPPEQVPSTAAAPKRSRVEAGSASSAAIADAAGTTKNDSMTSDSIRSVLAGVAVASPTTRAPVTGSAANQASADLDVRRQAIDGARREASRVGRPGSITELSTKGAGYAAALASPPAVGRVASAIGRFAGCYEIRLGVWTPAVTLGADTVYITPPRRIVLDTIPAAVPSRSSGFRVLPILDTPGRDDASWFAVGTDSLRISWTTGLNGLTMHLKLEHENLSGVATTFWNFDRKAQQSAVTGKRIACQQD